MRNSTSRRYATALTAVLLTGIIVTGLLRGSAESRDRAWDLAGQLRCPVCQAESVAASSSDTAIAIRDQIDQFIAEGRSDTEIFDHYMERYGEWVLLDPPVSGNTLVLWLAPMVFLLLGAGLVVVQRQRRSRGSRAPSVMTAPTADADHGGEERS